MGQQDSQQTLLDVFAKIDKYVAVVAAIISAITFAQGNKYVSYAFVIVACILVNAWLWRKAMARTQTGVVAASGKPTRRYTHSPVQRYAMQGAAIAITIVALLWTGLNLRADLRPTPAPQLTPTPTPDMVFIPAGTFIMGSESDLAKPDAGPKRNIYLDAYWIDIYEVTNEQYQQFLFSGHRPPSHWQGNKYPEGKGNCPVVNVSWYDATSYCSFVGKRLPTEAEWEKAARGTDGRLWPWGNDRDPSKANTGEEAEPGHVQPVGSYEDGNSTYGVADMAGNVWEWVDDWYEADYYTISPDRNPPGPPFAQTKVVRGGAWTDALDLTYTFYRLGIFPPNHYSEAIGFRCACTACRE